MRPVLMSVRGFNRDFEVETTKHEEPYVRAKWTLNEDKRKRRLRKWRQEHDWFDARAETFALSKAYFSLDDREDDAWECVGLLGQGSFGTVGKYCLFNSNGGVVDTIAIKQVQRAEWMISKNGEVMLPAEAAIPWFLYEQGCRTSVRIRNLRYFDVQRPKWRFYTDFHQYGTIYQLVTRYQKRNRGQGRKAHIPEGFIWQALYDIADIYHHMKNFEGSSPEPGNPEGHFILHLDIKDQNILLGSAPSDANFMPYSRLKVADWGLAECTTRRDSRNPRVFFGCGTVCWSPPEQFDMGRYGEGWEHRVMPGRTQPLTVAHSLWQLAACIYGMMELTLDNRKLDQQIKDVEGQERRLRSHDYSPLFGYENRNYSQELCRLVEDCLRVIPERRPTPSELQRRVNKGLQPFLNRWQRTREYEKVILE